MWYFALSVLLSIHLPVCHFSFLLIKFPQSSYLTVWLLSLSQDKTFKRPNINATVIWMPKWLPIHLQCCKGGLISLSERIRLILRSVDQSQDHSDLELKNRFRSKKLESVSFYSQLSYCIGWLPLVSQRNPLLMRFLFNRLKVKITV